MGDQEKNRIEIWKKARDTVEHFDNILSGFRKIAFGVNATIIPVLIKVWIDKKDPDFLLHSACIAFGWNLFNLFLWLAEKHYHLYMLAAVKTAKKIEESFTLQDRLTIAIGKMKDEQWRLSYLFNTHLHFYDFIYLVPVLLGAGVMFLFKPWLLVLLLAELYIISAIILRDEKLEDEDYSISCLKIIFNVVLIVVVLGLAWLLFHHQSSLVTFFINSFRK